MTVQCAGTSIGEAHAELIRSKCCRLDVTANHGRRSVCEAMSQMLLAEIRRV
jgi:hypothetical protein